MHLAPGTRLGTYEILGPLGAGAMGEVHRARDLRLGREIAIKVLPAGIAASAGRLARFEREARTVAGLNHPNIVTLYSVEEENGTPFLTMELLEGQSLDRLVAQGGLPLERVLELSIPLAEALAAAHERGVVHRDLKPSNVMLTREGRIKVLDFGLARIAQVAHDSEHTQAPTMTSPLTLDGQLIGTVPYMSPEQVRGDTAEPRSDLFAFGIMLYELAAGRRPFVGETYVDVGYAILRLPPEPLARTRDDLPAEFERIVARCLEKDPERRMQTAQELADALRALRRALERGAPEAFAAPVVGAVPSIAVLPFVNRGQDEDDAYFSDGLADELLTVLAKVPGLRVSARSSSFSFRGRDVPLAEIGRTLGVAAVLEGSVRKAGDRVRISVQLVQIAGGFHLWSETYDRTLDDIFAVQDDIAQSVVKELRARLLGRPADDAESGAARKDVAIAARGRGSDAEAHRLYLLARHHMGRYMREDLARAIGYLEQALARDPGFAIAWTELSRARAREADRGWVSAIDGYRRAREAAERALALEPALSEGHARMGWIRMAHDWDWWGSEASHARALELAPGSAQNLAQAGVLATCLGRFEESILLYRRALEHDPLSSGTFNNLGMALQAAGRPAEAEEALRTALDLTPGRGGTHAVLASVLLDLGRAEDALAAAEKELDGPWRLQAIAVVQHVLGNRAAADAALGALVESHAEHMACQIAEVHARRGNHDAAFEWLDRAYAQRDGGLADMQRSPHLRPLRDDPRWTALVHRMGFTESPPSRSGVA